MSAPTLSERLAEEVAQLPESIELRMLLWGLLVVGLTTAGRAAVLAAVQLVWRLGLDGARRLARVATLLRLALWLGGAAMALAPVVRVIPLLFTLSLAVFASLAALALPGSAQNIGAGLSLLLRGRFREGERIQVAGHRGLVRSIGIARTQLRADDGSTVWLPNRIFDAEPARVERASGSAPVQVVCRIPPEALVERREGLARATAMMPLRRAGTVPRITAVPGTTDTWIVEVQTWATRDLELAQASLAAVVAGVLWQPAGEEK